MRSTCTNAAAAVTTTDDDDVMHSIVLLIGAVKQMQREIQGESSHCAI